MPSSKKIPATIGRKKVMASARARNTIRNSKKSTVNQDASYIQNSVSKAVNMTDATPISQQVVHSQNDALLTLLQDMQKSNADIH